MIAGDQEGDDGHCADIADGEPREDEYPGGDHGADVEFGFDPGRLTAHGSYRNSRAI